MVSPINGYSQNVVPIASSRDSGLQPAAATARAPAAASPLGELGFSQPGNAAPAGPGLSRQNIALLEAMQAGRQNAALLSSLTVPGGSFYPAPSAWPIMPQGQSPAQRPNASLMEVMQAGRQNSALLSGMMGSAPGVRSFDFLGATRTQGDSIFANPQSALSNAQDIIRATNTAQPWIQDGRIAHMAYLMEIQAQRQVEQSSMGGNQLRTLFA